MIAAIVIAATAAAPSAKAASASDACSLLTPAQVSSALGASVGAGTYVTPEFKKTCTWTVTAGHEFVTLMLENADWFQSGKVPMVSSIVVTPAGGVGDDAYYLAVGQNVGLIVKKGKVSFKVAVYASDTPLGKKEALEKSLAQQVVSRL
jgi:hypothetical protein